MAADGLQAISVSSSIGLAPNNSRARPRGLRTSWATRSPISEGSADECCKRARRKGLLKGLVRSALQCKSVGEGDLRYTELVRSEARFDSEPLEVERYEVADTSSVALVDLPEFARLQSAPHCVELEFSRQQAPTVVFAEDAVSAFDRRSQIAGGLDAVERVAERLDLGVEMTTDEFDK
jgi:hypothetical protein